MSLLQLLSLLFLFAAYCMMFVARESESKRKELLMGRLLCGDFAA
jgi:hypothetical protein